MTILDCTGQDVPKLCGTDTFSTGRFISDSPAATKPHFIMGAQKKTAADGTQLPQKTQSNDRGNEQGKQLHATMMDRPRR